MSDYQMAFVKGLRYEAKDIISVELTPAEEHFKPFEAGSHIDLYLPNGLIRSYSLFNSPMDKDRYILGVLSNHKSEGGSVYIHTQLKLGQILKISNPRNNFPLDEQANHTVLVAGGIGITPIYSMLLRLLALGRSVELVYCARSRVEAAYLTELERLNVKTTWHFDDEKKALPILENYLAGQAKDTHFYCCGPTAMIDSFEVACQKLGYTHVHVERFSAKPTEVSTEKAHGYTVELVKSGKTIEVPAGKSLLDTLLEAGINVNYACREGVCGACKTKVLEGIPDHHDSLLSPSQKVANDVMLICVSGCKGDKLVLDL